MKKMILVLSLLILWHNAAWSASVATSKNQKVLINLEGDEVAVNDEFFLINPVNNKKSAIIRVIQVKNGKAIATILKGSADVGYTLQAKASSGGAVPEARPTEDHTASREQAPEKNARDTGYLHTLKTSYGLMAEYLQNSMSVTVKNTTVTPALTDTVALKGSSFGVGGFYDYIATPDIAIQLGTFFEQVKANGTASIPGCAGATTTACDVNINYLSFYGTGKYYLTHSKYRIWGGIGGGFLLALSKSSTALNESNISTNQILTLSLGTDIQTSRKNYIPVVLEYNYFPSSDTVKAATIVLKAGWAWNQ